MEPYAMEAELLKVLGHPARLQVVAMLAREETCVCDLLPAIGIEQSNLSQHLKLLRKHGIVAARKDGAKMMYRLINPAVLPLVGQASQAVQEHLEQMAALAAEKRS